MRLYRDSFESKPIFTSLEASELDEFAFSLFLVAGFKFSRSLEVWEARFLRRFGLRCSLDFEGVLLTFLLLSLEFCFSHLVSKQSDLELKVAFNSDSFRRECSSFFTGLVVSRFSRLDFSCSSGKNIASSLDTGEGSPSQGSVTISPAEGDCYTSFSVGELVEMELIVLELFEIDCT